MRRSSNNFAPNYVYLEKEGAFGALTWKSLVGACSVNFALMGSLVLGSFIPSDYFWLVMLPIWLILLPVAALPYRLAWREFRAGVKLSAVEKQALEEFMRKHKLDYSQLRDYYARVAVEAIKLARSRTADLLMSNPQISEVTRQELEMAFASHLELAKGELNQDG